MLSLSQTETQHLGLKILNQINCLFPFDLRSPFPRVFSGPCFDIHAYQMTLCTNKEHFQKQNSTEPFLSLSLSLNLKL